MSYMKTLNPLGFLPNPLNRICADERRIVLYLDQWAMSNKP